MEQGAGGNAETSVSSLTDRSAERIDQSQCNPTLAAPLGAAPEKVIDGLAPGRANGHASIGLKHVFSWDNFEPEMKFTERYALWHDIYVSRYGASDFSPPEDRHYLANAEFAPLGTVGITRFDVSMRYFRRNAAHVAVDGRDDVLFGFNRAGVFGGRCGRRDVEVPTGDLFVFTNAEPSITDHADNLMAVTGLSVPRARLAEFVGNPEDLFGVVSGQSQAARHLLRYAELLLDDDSPMRDPTVNNRIETMLLDLIALTVGAKRDMAELAKERGLRAARLATVKTDIRESMARPGFSVASVAKRQGVSPRYIHILFENEGKTFTEYVHEQRLKEAERMLTSASFSGMRIGDIAYAVGFAEQSTFNRLFRQAFGATPTEMRETARQQDRQRLEGR